MILHNSLSEKSEQQSFSRSFSQLKVNQHLRSAGIKKTFGCSAKDVFQIIFQLVFLGKNWFRLLNSDRKNDLPGKDTVYRFLNYGRYAWRKFLHSISLSMVQSFDKLTSSSRVKVFIVDDSFLQRNRSKKAELLARLYDHASHRFMKGYNMLTLGWSDGFSFLPIDFTMLSSAKQSNRLCEMKEDLDKRTHGYKRRQEALTKKPDALVQMVTNALNTGFSADYILMDSWFTQAPLLRKLVEKEVHVIGMVKELKQRYLYKGQKLSLQELFDKTPKNRKVSIIGSILVQTSCGLPLKIVFVQNRNNRREWLAILSTDIGLEDSEIVRIYGMRWSIETFFKFAKSYLKLGTEFQGRSFDMLISHTSIVFTRYLILEWERRNNCDDRTFGGLFYLFCDEVRDMDLKTALQHLMVFILTILDKRPKNEKTTILCQLNNWISCLPNYIKDLLVNWSCES